jgi:hypothetical protein
MCCKRYLDTKACTLSKWHWVTNLPREDSEDGIKRRDEYRRGGEGIAAPRPA